MVAPVQKILDQPMYILLKCWVPCTQDAAPYSKKKWNPVYSLAKTSKIHIDDPSHKYVCPRAGQPVLKC
jgi:hypothetical protein